MRFALLKLRARRPNRKTEKKRNVCNSAAQQPHWTLPFASNPENQHAPAIRQRARVNVPNIRGVRGPRWYRSSTWSAMRRFAILVFLFFMLFPRND